MQVTLETLHQQVLAVRVLVELLHLTKLSPKSASKPLVIASRSELLLEYHDIEGLVSMVYGANAGHPSVLPAQVKKWLMDYLGSSDLPLIRKS